jgi:hypothetical protein
MAVVVRYNPQSLTREKYDAGVQAIGENAQSPDVPDALLLHVLFGDDGNMRVSEIWESEAAWREAWDGLLRPSLEQAGIEFASDPEVHDAPVYWGAGLPGPPAPPA